MKPLTEAMDTSRIRKRIRNWTLFFIGALWFSGLTAVPLEWGTQWLSDFTMGWPGQWHTWAESAAIAIADVGSKYPFLFYGTDWLAFAHIVIGLAFFGVLRDPVRNKWIIEWGCGVVRWCFYWRSLGHLYAAFRSSGVVSMHHSGLSVRSRCGWCFGISAVWNNMLNAWGYDEEASFLVG
ncbi:MAG: hypothetical protein IPP33_00410 [Flavobacteriales bacterium]|nr:hypothetical protein [Flavobacteriales bacterium]